MPRMGNIKLIQECKPRARGNRLIPASDLINIFFSQVSRTATFTAMPRTIKNQDICEKFI